MYRDTEEQLAAIRSAVSAAQILEKDVYVLSDLSIITDPTNVPIHRVLEVVRYKRDDDWDVD